MGEEKYYIGHSVNPEVRHNASSGGVGFSLISYLLSSGEYGTAVTFRFDKDSCAYKPLLVYEPASLFTKGSIYQDIALIDFIRDNIFSIRGGIVVTCLPCQVRAIRHLLDERNIKSFIITFACSGQTLLEGTHCYYRLLGIGRSDVENIRYRGCGWPGGILITKIDGENIFRPNYTEPWKSLQMSMLYRPKRCFLCVKDTDRTADISMADPWLERYKTEKEGKTLFSVNTARGQNAIEALIRQGFIVVKLSSNKDWKISQAPNVAKKEFVKENRKALKIISTLVANSFYRNIFSKNIFMLKMHCRILRIIIRLNRSKS